MSHRVIDWQKHFTATGAIWSYAHHGPHAAYRLERKHSDWYFNTEVVVSDPVQLDEVVRTGLAPLVGDRPDWVIAPVTSITAGLVLATGLARHLGVRVAGCDVRERTFSSPIGSGGTAIICTDDLHGGGSARVTHDALVASGLRVLKVVALANFSPLARVGGVAVESLFSHRFGVWDADHCPLCAAGSRAIDARMHWADLGNSRTV